MSNLRTHIREENARPEAGSVHGLFFCLSQNLTFPDLPPALFCELYSEAGFGIISFIQRESISFQETGRTAERMKRQRLGEIIRFVIAGGAGFAVELGALILLKEKAGLDTLIAVPIAFFLSVIVNYLICVFWVFSGAREQSRKNQVAFFLTSAVGLLLNELLMFLFRVMWGEDPVLFTVFSFPVSLYVMNKILSTGIVMIWNYLTKRYILTKG